VNKQPSCLNTKILWTPWEKVQARDRGVILLQEVFLKVAVCRQPLSFSFSCKECNFGVAQFYLRKWPIINKAPRVFITQTFRNICVLSKYYN
jgi:hypothetical protein